MVTAVGQTRAGRTAAAAKSSGAPSAMSGSPSRVESATSPWCRPSGTQSGGSEKTTRRRRSGETSRTRLAIGERSAGDPAPVQRSRDETVLTQTSNTRAESVKDNDAAVRARLAEKLSADELALLDDLERER